MEPQALTMTAWQISKPAVERLTTEHAVPERQNPIAIMSMHSANLKMSTLCHMGAFILRQLGKDLGLERASEIVFQTAQTMTMRAQFKTGPSPADAEYGDERPDWEREDREPREEDFEDDYDEEENNNWDGGYPPC